VKVGGNNNFRQSGGKLNFQKNLKIFRKQRGKSETGGKCIMVSGGMDAPEYCTLAVTEG